MLGQTLHASEKKNKPTNRYVKARLVGVRYGGIPPPHLGKGLGRVIPSSGESEPSVEIFSLWGLKMRILEHSPTGWPI